MLRFLVGVPPDLARANPARDPGAVCILSIFVVILIGPKVSRLSPLVVRVRPDALEAMLGLAAPRREVIVIGPEERVLTPLFPSTSDGDLPQARATWHSSMKARTLRQIASPIARWAPLRGQSSLHSPLQVQFRHTSDPSWNLGILEAALPEPW